LTKLLPSSIISRIVLLCLLLISLSVLAVGGLAFWNVRSDVMDSADADTHKAMRTLGLVWEAALPGARVELKDGEVTRIVEGVSKLSGYDVVDRAAASIGGVATVFDKQGGDYVRISTNVKTEKGERAVGTKLATDHPAQARLARGEAYYGAAVLFGQDYMTGYFPVTDVAGRVTGALFIGIPIEIYLSHIATSGYIVVITSLVALLVMAALSFFALRALIRPLGVLTGSVRAIAAGDVTAPIPYAALDNEFGNIARALQIFRDNALEKERIEKQGAEQRAASEAERARNDADKRLVDLQIDTAVTELGSALSKLAQGDLSVSIATTFAGKLETLRTDFNQSVVHLRQTLTHIRASTLAIQRNSAELSQSATELSRRTESQAASLEETAAAFDEITVTVRSSAERAHEANQAVTITRQSADDSGLVVKSAVAAMARIEQASKKIEMIIEVIDDIAFQTNLLALNAGIEAARAGDAGRGFAVVAQEVRELAQRSASAAREIKGLINQSTSEVNSGSALVQQAGEVLARISSDITVISKHVGTIATASQDQSAALQEINTSVNKMDQMTQQNGAMVEETSEASRQLAGEAQALLDLVEQFRIEADHRGMGQGRMRAA
jgi:methyl-accepting chemotaxis protein